MVVGPTGAYGRKPSRRNTVENKVAAATPLRGSEDRSGLRAESRHESDEARLAFEIRSLSFGSDRHRR